MSNRERLYLFDTTLRDGAQTNGVDFSLEDKLADRQACSTSSASTMSRAAIRAPTRPTPSFFAREAQARRDVHRLRHDAAAGPLGLERSRASRRCSTPRPTRSASSPSRGTITSASRSRCTDEENLASIRDSVQAAKAEGPRGAGRLRAFLRRLQGQSATMRSPAPRRPTRPARAGSCCATPMAARCRTRSRRSSARWRSTCPATISASTRITTPSRRWPTRSPRCAPARARSRARSTASASAAATPISSRSSRR